MSNFNPPSDHHCLIFVHGPNAIIQRIIGSPTQVVLGTTYSDTLPTDLSTSSMILLAWFAPGNIHYSKPISFENMKLRQNLISQQFNTVACNESKGGTFWYTPLNKTCDLVPLYALII